MNSRLRTPENSPTQEGHPVESSAPSPSTNPRVWSSREFVITLAVMLVGLVLILTGDKDDGIALIQWVALGYIGSRTVAKFKR